MTNAAAGSYANYQAYWEEVVQCYANDTAYGDASRAFLSFEDYANVAYDFSHIEGAKLIAPMWVVDDMFTYINPVVRPDLWNTVRDVISHKPLMPLTLGAFNEDSSGTSIHVFFKDFVSSCRVQENIHLMSYDYYLDIENGTVLNPFAQFGGRRVSPVNEIFYLDDYLDNQLPWIPCGLLSGYKVTDVRMYLYCLSKRIKTRYQSIQVKVGTIQRSMDMVKSDTNVLESLSHEMQKALLVKTIITNPYVSCRLVIV